MKSMKLGLTGRDIDKLLAPFDNATDGSVDYLEFERRYRTREEGNMKPQKNSKYKIAKLRELMYHYMISPKDTFRFVSIINKQPISTIKTVLAILRSCNLTAWCADSASVRRKRRHPIRS